MKVKDFLKGAKIVDYKRQGEEPVGKDFKYTLKLKKTKND
jgi:hypothetical protein